MSEKNNDLNSKEYPSMDITYEWGRQTPEQLSREASLLDTKIIGILASASIIISLISIKITAITLDLTIIPLAIAFISFLVIFGMSVWALKGRSFSIADDPEILQNEYWKLSPREAKITYWKYVIKYFKLNYSAFHIKSRVLRCIVPILGVEVITLLAWLICSLFTTLPID